MWNYLKSIFIRPGANFASFISGTVPVSVSTADAINDKYQEAFDDACFDIAKAQAFENSGLSLLQNANSELVSDAHGKYYDFKESAGLFNLQEFSTMQTGKSMSLTHVNFDLSDQEDYQNRYFSLDLLRRNNDASDVAFFNVVTNDYEHKNIFPNYTDYKQPGLTKTKFRQFILLQIQEASQEKMQLVETSDNFQALFFGKKPEILQISGVLKNTTDNPWSTNMLFAWSELMRGTKLVENGWILQLYADGELFRGYPFMFGRSKAAPNDFLVNFSMSFVIKERIQVYANMDLETYMNTEGYQAKEGNIL